MSIEVVSATKQQEAFIHCVGERPGDIFENYYEVGQPGIEAVRSIEFGNPQIIESMAWVDLSERAVVRIKHEGNPEIHNYNERPYGVPDYPEETMLGNRMIYGDTWLVTDVHDSEMEFTALSEIIQSNRITPYTLRWLSTIAASNYRPVFYYKIDQHITGAPMSTADEYEQVRGGNR